MASAQPSKMQVNRAGDLLRDWMTSELPVTTLDQPEYEDALRVMVAYRRRIDPYLHRTS